MTKYIDQLLPFLEAAPGWFKIWFYVLIVLICVTVAAAFVFYFTEKDRQFTMRGYDTFQIETPENGDEIPTNRWLVRGRFPVFETPDNGSLQKPA